MAIKNGCVLRGVCVCVLECIAGLFNLQKVQLPQAIDTIVELHAYVTGGLLRF